MIFIYFKNILNDDEFTIEGTSNNDPNEIVYTKNTNETGKYTYTIQLLLHLLQ